MCGDLEYLPHPKKLLAESNKRARRSLGQNFLVNRDLLKKIAVYVSTGGSPTVLEVGPGLGHLTILLCCFYKHVIAIEKDEGLAADLRRRLNERSNLEVIAGDATEISIGERLKHHSEGYDVVGNLPFYCATEILFHFLEEDKPAERMVFMFQKEVARRILAKPGSKEYGALTVACNSLSSPKVLFPVSAGSFYPKPDVDGVVLTFSPKKERLSSEKRSCLREILQAGFSGRRKKLRNAFKKRGLWEELILCEKTDLERLGSARPDAISPEDYFMLADVLSKARSR